MLCALKKVCHATGKYTVFGHVIDGMEVLDKMEKVPTGDLVPRDMFMHGGHELLQSLCMQLMVWHWRATRVIHDFHVQEHLTGRRRISR